MPLRLWCRALSVAGGNAIDWPQLQKFKGPRRGPGEDGMRKILMLTASCLMAANFIGPAAVAQNAEAEAAAARASAAAAAARANAQVSPNDTLEKICRIGPRSRETEIQKIEPFKAFDNLYHVGPCYVDSWVLTTPQGDILFDTAQEPFVDLIEANIKKVGVNPRDIKYIIINTAPGHTPGNMFIEGLVLHEGAQTYRGIWGGGGGGAPGLAGAEQGVKNAEKLNAVKGVQVYLQTHAWQDPNGYPGGGIHERAKKLANRKPGDPNPFVDPATWDARAKRQLETAKRVLAQEQAKAGATKTN